MANEAVKVSPRGTGEDAVINVDSRTMKKSSRKIFKNIRHWFRRRSGKHVDDDDVGAGNAGQNVDWSESRRVSDALRSGVASPTRDDEESTSSSAAPFPASRLSMSHDSVFSPDPQASSPRQCTSVSSLDASTSSLNNAKALGMRAISNELKDNPIFRRQRTRETSYGTSSSAGEDLGLPQSPNDSPSAASAVHAAAHHAACAVLYGGGVGGMRNKVVRNRDGRSEGSLLSMGSSEHDEDSGFGQTSRHSSKLSLTEKKSQDVGGDWDLGEPPLGAAPLSHSAARHKMAVRPRRTMAGPTRHRRLQQLSASVLPSMPEMNEDVVMVGGGSHSHSYHSQALAKSQSENLEYFSSSSAAAMMSSSGHHHVVVGSTSASVKAQTSNMVASSTVTTTTASSVASYSRREKFSRASVRPNTPSPTHSPSTKLSRSKSTGADRKIRHEVERYENKRIDFDPKSTPLRHVSPPKRLPATPLGEDGGRQQTKAASSTSVNSATVETTTTGITSSVFGRESRRRDLRRIKKEKEEKKNGSNGHLNAAAAVAGAGKASAPEDVSAVQAATANATPGNTFFSRLFGSRRSYKKKKEKHGDENGATTDDDDDGGFSSAARRTPAASVSPHRRMDPMGGYAQDTDNKFVTPDVYNREPDVLPTPPPSSGTAVSGKVPLLKKFPLRASRANNNSSNSHNNKEDGDEKNDGLGLFGGKKSAVAAAATADVGNKGEDSVVIQPDVIRKAVVVGDQQQTPSSSLAVPPQRPNFLVGSVVTSNGHQQPVKPARTSLPFGRPSLLHPHNNSGAGANNNNNNNNNGHQNPQGTSPKPARIEGLSRFQRKVMLADDDDGDFDDNMANEDGRKKSAASTPDADADRIPIASILRPARSFRQVNNGNGSGNNNNNPEFNLKRLSQQPQRSSQDLLLKDELETKWQLRRSQASFEKLEPQPSPPLNSSSSSAAVVMRDKKEKTATTEENTEHRRRSLFGEILRPTGFFERAHSPTVNGNGNDSSGPMSLDSVLTSRTEDDGLIGDGGSGGGDNSSGTGGSLSSTGPMSLVLPQSSSSRGGGGSVAVVNNKRPIMAIRSSSRRTELLDDDYYDDDDDGGDGGDVDEPPLKPKLWECKVRKFERNAPASSSSSSTSSAASSSSTSSSSCSAPASAAAAASAPASPGQQLMETDLDDDVVGEANPIVASFLVGARPSFMAGSGTATTRPRATATAADDPASSKTVIKIGVTRKNSASKIPVLSAAPSVTTPTSSAVPASASLVAAALGKTSSAVANGENDVVRMRNKPAPVPAAAGNGEAVFSRASLRPSASANPAVAVPEKGPQQPGAAATAASELLKVFQRRSLKAKDAESLQAQVVELLDRETERTASSVAAPTEDKPPAPPPQLSNEPQVEKPKLVASKSLGAALVGNGAAGKSAAAVLDHPVVKAAPSVPSVSVSAPTPQPASGSAQNEAVPEWKRLAQQRKEKREQFEQLSVKGDADSDNPARNAAARSSKVLDLVNNFQKRVTEPPTTTNL